LSNDAGWLSLFNCNSNTDGNGRSRENILVRCPLEALFETFFAKVNVRQYTNKSEGIQVMVQFTVVPCKQKFSNVRKCLTLMLTRPVPNSIKIRSTILQLFHADGQTGGRSDINP